MRREILVGFLLVTAVTLVYLPVRSYPFVLLDDAGYVYENPLVRNGITAQGIGYAFTGVTVGNWHPLTMLSHMLDSQLFGAKDANAGGHHLVNLALHAANTLLLFVALRRMTGAVWRSGLVAALFGLHPFHVESVAWISERKDVLSTFFFMLVLLAYHHYAQRRTLLRYATVFVLLALGLMSKPMLVTTPFVLLLLDYWPLGRVEQGAGSTEQTEKNDESVEENKEPKAEEGEQDAGSDLTLAASCSDLPAPRSQFPAVWPLVAEKIPLFMLVACSAVATYLVQGTSGAMGMLGRNLSLASRLGNAVCAYGIYLEKAVWPYPLAAIYPYTTHNTIDVLIIGAALAAITVAAFRLAHIKPYLNVGWGWYLVTLLPVIGLVQVGVQSMADRYTYIPLIGLFVIAAWGGADLAEGLSSMGKTAAVAASAAVLLVFAWLTSQQLTTWSGSEALFRHAAEAVPNNYVAMDGLGGAYWQQGRLEEAQQQYEAIVKMETDPRLHIVGGLEPAHRELGMLLAVRHKPRQAIEQLDEAIRLQPTLPDARRHKAWLLATYPDERFRDGREAVQLAKEAIERSPWKPTEFWDTLAAAEAESGNFAKAVEAEQKAVDTARRTRADDILPGLEERLDLFKSGKPYHAEPQRPSRM